MHKEAPAERIAQGSSTGHGEIGEVNESNAAPAFEPDSQCLLDRDARVRDAEPHFAATVEQRGLLKFANGFLLPALREHHGLWLDTINTVRLSGKGKYFALISHPQLESIGIAPHPDSALVSVRLPRTRLSSAESVSGYATLIRLTPRESHVLDLIVQGKNPASIASTLRTRESTVRTQIKSILAKSNHHSVRDLLVTVACLPSIDPVCSSADPAAEAMLRQLAPLADQRPAIADADDCRLGAD